MLFDENFVKGKTFIIHYSRLTEEYTACLDNNTPSRTTSNVIGLAQLTIWMVQLQLVVSYVMNMVIGSLGFPEVSEIA
ncbi:hypothetical protein GQ457_01G025530 [Hibiscus cannabinus]